MKLPAHVLFRKKVSLILWKPRGVLDQSTVDEMMEFIEAVEKRNSKPLDRFNDLSALDAVDLNFDFVFHVALGRRLGRARARSEIRLLRDEPDQYHYAKLHAMLTDYSPLDVTLFTDRVARRSGSAFLSRRCPIGTEEYFNKSKQR